MKSRSAKNKGLRLQNKVKEMILSIFSSLHPDDVKPAIMGESGEDIHLSPAARNKIPFSIECKNTEKLQMWKALEQAEYNANKNNSTALVVFKRNRSKIYCTLEFEVLLKLLNEK